jgi:hypothetical protein
LVGAFHGTEAHPDFPATQHLAAAEVCQRRATSTRPSREKVFHHHEIALVETNKWKEYGEMTPIRSREQARDNSANLPAQVRVHRPLFHIFIGERPGRQKYAVIPS